MKSELGIANTTSPPPRARSRLLDLLKACAGTVGWIVLRAVLYAASVLFLIYLASVALSYVPFFSITTTPDTAVINKVGLSLQSLKHFLFEDELGRLYAPSPPPPPLRR